MSDASCPTVARVLDRVDGGLARIRVPGGRLRAEQLAVVAAAARLHGADVIEITNRSNLQLRGVAPANVSRLAADLVDAGCSAGPRRDLRRNVLMGPLGGLDPTETADLHPLLDPLLELLDGDRRLDGLSAKFGVVVDGGGRWHLAGRRDDVVVVARPGKEPAAEVRVVRMPPARVAVSEVPAAVHAAALASLGQAPRRTVGVPTPTGSDTAPAAIVGPLGVGAQSDPQQRWVGAMPMLGRMDGATAAGVAALADRFAGGVVRCTPWRGLVLGDVAAQDAPRVQRELEQLGLVADPDDPGVAVVACAGCTGCTSAFTDAVADARAVIGARRGEGGAPMGVHVSGCTKRCAQRVPAALTLLATSPGSYDVLVAEPAAPGGERLVARGLTPGAAVALAARREPLR